MFWKCFHEYIELSSRFTKSYKTLLLPLFPKTLSPISVLPFHKNSKRKPSFQSKVHMSSDMGKWSELPNELLAMVLDCLPLFIDCIRFGAVCSSWYDVTKENSHWLDFQGQFPLMMVPDKERTETRGFYSITKNKLYNIQLPEFHGKWCCGSSMGWVVTVDENANVHLLHPFTSTQIQLPSLDKFPDNQNHTRDDKPRDYRYLVKTVLSANPISTPDYIVAAIVDNGRKLAFYKPGDEKWTTINNEWAHTVSQWVHYYDVIYYKYKFYAITNRNTVVTLDFASNDFPKLTMITHPVNECAEMRYLVESSGRLLKVLRYQDWNPYYDDEVEPESAYETTGFEVFELEQETGKWIKIESLGDQMLFLGYNSSLSLSALDFPQCKGNCIYFTDDFENLCNWGYDNGVFNLEDESLKSFYPCSSTWTTKPIWVPPYFSK
ncbi:putative F-box protein At5g55150 [Tasmannia lanceolata]|uniref:putative F-box protein At5g55150 n=1 Tax=Tasmannia lanceolata TaxID=3420 RepID=UPI00406359EE